MTGPAAIADVVLWLRAKDLGAGGSTVTSWPDVSGSARPGVATGAPAVVAAATPSGGKAVSFGATDAFNLPSLAFPVDASSVNSTSYAPTNAIDGNTSTLWASADIATNGPQWLRVHLATAYAATSYTIAPRTDVLQDGPKDFTFEGSNDGGDTWVVLDTRASITWPTAAAQTFTFSNATGYRWYRLRVTAAGTLVQVSELSIPGATFASGAGEVWLVVRGNATNTSGNTSWTFGTSGTPNYYGYNTSQTIYDATGTATRQQFNATMPVNGQWRLIRVTSDGVWTFYLDGTQQATATVSPSWRYNPTLRLSNGQIAEMVVRGKVSTSGEVASLIGYFNTEHGLSVPGGTTPSSDVTGTIAASAPAPSVAIAGAASAMPVTGTIAASAPAPSVAIAGAINGAKLGTITATAPAPVAAIVATTGVPGAVLGGWVSDDSQRARLQFTSNSGTLIVTAPVAAAPVTITERPLMRQSHQMPAPTPDADGRVRSLGDYTIEEDANVGVPHIWVNGQDVTYFRDAPTTIGQWSSSQPGGDETAAVDFPQLTPFDVAGVGDLSWLKADAPVEIAIVRPDGTRLHQFAGHLVSDNAGHTGTSLSNGWHVEGSLAQADYFGHRVPTMLEPTDIGSLISKHLNGVVSRRYGALATVATGVLTRQRGAYGDTEWDYVQNLLGTAWTEAGTQWTIARTSRARQYVVRQKDLTTQHWTLTAGAPGVEPDLTRDDSQRVDAIYGRGVGPDGYAWANWKYPNLLPDDAPAYPFSGAGSVISVGTTDATTDSGDGVSTWQERARALGYTLTVDGVFSSADSDVTRQIQRRYGLSVDGVVGPQTWAASFAVGSNGGDLSGSYRAPLAIRTEVEPYLYAANGAVTGKNPNYTPGIIRHERDVDYGPGVTKAEATASALREMSRDADPGWAGTITLTTDPWEGSKWEMFEGQNVRLLGWRGQDLLLHIVEITKDPQSLTVTLTVDSKARDAMTLSSVLERDREAKADPARRPGNVNRRSRQEQDMAVEFDGESGAGVIPKHAIYGGLWTVIRIPVSQVGRIAKVDVRTSGPAAKFCLALFGKPVQPSHLKRLVGDPLAGDNPFARTESAAVSLDDDFGFIEAFGGPGSAAGYWPKQETDGPLTGRLVDTGGLDYVSAKPPWVWVAEWSPTSTFVSGRLLPAPIQ